MKSWVMLLTTITVVFVIAAGMINGPTANSNFLRGNTRFVVNQSSAQNDSLYQNGERLARIWGCYDGCHAGETMTSYNMAPALTNFVQSYSVSDLKTVIEEGKRPGGSDITAMPPSMFTFVEDEDLEAILTFLQNVRKNEAE